MGDYALERFFLGVIVYILLLMLIVLRGKRKMIFGLILAVLLCYGLFFYIRGLMHEHKYKQSVEIVNEYLDKKYSNEEWIVIDTLEKGRMRRANRVEIIFLNEDQVIYSYRIINENKVVQWEIAPGGKDLDDLLHVEFKK